MKFPDFKTIREKTLNLNFAVGLIVVGLFVIGLSLLLLLPFRDYWLAKPIDNALVGQFGDFIGGIAGSFWALAGVIMFYVALHEQRNDFANNREDSKTNRQLLEAQLKEFQLQQEELVETREVFREQSQTQQIQRFETSFFNMLVAFTEMVKSFSSEKTTLSKNGERKVQSLGREAFSEICLAMERSFANEMQKVNDLSEAWESIQMQEYYMTRVDWNSTRVYIRMLEQVVFLVFNSKLDDDRNRYIDIFKSMLDEMQFSLLGLYLIRNSDEHQSLLVYMKVLEFYDKYSFGRLSSIKFAQPLLEKTISESKIHFNKD